MIPFLDLLDRLFRRSRTPEGKRLRARAAEGRASVYERRADRFDGRRAERLREWADAARARAKTLREEAGS